MRKALLVATAMAAATLHLAYGQSDVTSRRDPDTELFTRHPESTDPHYARVDRFEQLFETHSSPARADQRVVPDRWWQQ
jgi:hypothetical protein